ncbi:proteasome assembly chaperone 2-like [Centruroides sculpturatus]|uniref:proteasome assembly chaperone 2-like n=1 Tax=Centruroides sculpturatus TaxID=218467 RepID=UPI000C6DDC1F|nr:proteasome assembly chaperone 2-like [Centruroides sculpturatus]
MDISLFQPVISVGNVGQLAVDLLLENLHFTCVGRIHSSTILPLVGLDPFLENSSDLVTSCQVYENTQLNLVVIQQRTPVAMNQRSLYVKLMANWIKECNFKKVVLLSSKLSQFESPSDMSTPFFLLSLSEDENSIKDYLIQKLNWKYLECKDPETHEVKPDGELHLPGAGITKLFYEKCFREKIPIIVLIQNCSEGDNIPDALKVVEQLNEWLKFDSALKRWRMPISWNNLFGNAPPSDIY